MRKLTTILCTVLILSSSLFGQQQVINQPPVPNNTFYGGQTKTTSIQEPLIGLNTSNQVSIDPNGLGTVMGGTLTVNGSLVPSGTGAANTIAKFTAANTLGNSSLTDNGTLVSIKPTTGTGTLQVSNPGGTIVGQFDAGGSGAEIGSFTNQQFSIYSNDITALTLDTSQNATFAGAADFNGFTHSTEIVGIAGANQALNAGDGNLRVFSNNAGAIDLGGTIGLGGNANGGSAASVAVIAGRYENGGAANYAGYLQLSASNSGHTMAEVLRLSGSTLNATFAGGVIAVGSVTLESGLLANNGAVGAPSIAFTADTSTGMYRSGAEVIGFAASGALIAQVNQSGILVTGTVGITSYVRANTAGTSGTAANFGGTGYWSGLTSESGTKSTLCIDPVTFQIETNAAATCTVSALKFKDNIKSVNPTDALSMVLATKPSYFDYKNGEKNQVGFIADWSPDERLIDRDSKGEISSFKYENFTAYLAGAIQSMQAEIDGLKAQLAGKHE